MNYNQDYTSRIDDQDADAWMEYIPPASYDVIFGLLEYPDNRNLPTLLRHAFMAGRKSTR